MFLPVAVGVCVAFIGAILLAVSRGRRRAAGRGRSDNHVAEGIYVAVLAIAAGILVAVSFASEDDVRAADESPGLAGTGIHRLSPRRFRLRRGP